MSQIDMVAFVPSENVSGQRRLQVCGDFSPRFPESPRLAEIHVAIRQGGIIARGNTTFDSPNWQVFIDQAAGLVAGPAIACAVAFLEKDPAGLETLSWVQKVHIIDIRGGPTRKPNTEFEFPPPESINSADGQVQDEHSVSSSLAIFEEANPQGPGTLGWHREFSIRPVEFAEVVSPEINKGIVQAYVEAVWNQRQVDRAEEFVAPDYLDHASLPGQAPGLAGAKSKWTMYLAGIPDLRVTIEELVAEGDKVGVRRTYEGTQEGELLGVPATGKQVRIGGISIFRLAEGKIAESWEQVDLLSLMRQLGVLPAAGQAAP